MSEKNMELWRRVQAVPSSAKSRITGGRMSGKTNIRPQWRLQVLTDQFGPCGAGWYYETVERWKDEGCDEVSVHVRIRLYVRNGEAWSSPIEGQGGSMLVAKETKGLYHSDEAWKMATTDALSVACKQLGIASDVYMDIDSSKYESARLPSDQEVAGAALLRGCKTITSLKSEWTRIWRESDQATRTALTLVYNEQKRRLSK